MDAKRLAKSAVRSWGECDAIPTPQCGWVFPIWGPTAKPLGWREIETSMETVDAAGGRREWSRFTACRLRDFAVSTFRTRILAGGETTGDTPPDSVLGQRLQLVSSPASSVGDP